MKKRKNRLAADALSDAAIASSVKKLKNTLSAVDEANELKRLTDRGYTQGEIAESTGKSRSAVANTLRLLTLDGAVLEMVKSGELSAGHARALVKVPKEKQAAFARETVAGGYSVRQAERAVKSFLTPPEVLSAEKAATVAAKNEELRSFVERMRAALKLKVSFVGSEKKGRVCIDCFCADDFKRLAKCVATIEQSPDLIN